MRGSGRTVNNQGFGNHCLTETETLSKQGSLLQIKNGTKRFNTKKHKPKLKSHGNTIGSTVLKKKVVKSVSKRMRNDTSSRNGISKTSMHKKKSSKRKHSSNLQGEKQSLNCSSEIGKHAKGGITSQKLKKRRKRKRQTDNTELDEPSRLQRRTRYLLIKMKLEQNLIDAYSGEGWKGQSREKIKPERELQRAKKQILKCKLGIRDAIRQLDLLSSVGCMENSAIAADGSVYHEHIICAKCKLREAFPDNDIILCDGTCNCAFHQKCLDPPLSTESIPPGDQGWFCKFCMCKMDILEAMNAHLGTHFSADSHWQDIFKEEAVLPDGGGALQDQEEWPSDDSEDDDYDPEKIENSCGYSRSGSEADASDDECSSSSLWSLEDEFFSESGGPAKRSKASWNTPFESFMGIDSDETTDCEILSGPRQRRAVDYKKLYDEMFGKDAPVSEQISEDEDWGPARRKRREKESDAASTLMTLSESKKKLPNVNATEGKDKLPPSGKTKRSFFRIPQNVVEKLRLAFAENELPSRAVRENLSMQLGLESEKVNKWFKNARYVALKARKAEKAKEIQNVGPKCTKESGSKIEKEKTEGQLASKDISSATAVHSPKHLNKIFRKNLQCPNSSLKKKHPNRSLLDNNEDAMEFGDDVSLKLLKAFAKEKKKKKKKKRVNFMAGVAGVREPEAELERLCKIKSKIEKLQQVLRGLPSCKSNKADASIMNEHSVIYVPVAELIEKKADFAPSA